MSIGRHIMSHGKRTHQKYTWSCCTPRDSISTNHEARFSLVIRQKLAILGFSTVVCVRPIYKNAIVAFLRYFSR